MWNRDVIRATDTKMRFINVQLFKAVVLDVQPVSEYR
jgi:hypothetical protein